MHSILYAEPWKSTQQHADWFFVVTQQAKSFLQFAVVVWESGWLLHQWMRFVMNDWQNFTKKWLYMMKDFHFAIWQRNILKDCRIQEISYMIIKIVKIMSHFSLQNETCKIFVHDKLQHYWVKWISLLIFPKCSLTERGDSPFPCVKVELVPWCFMEGYFT